MRRPGGGGGDAVVRGVAAPVAVVAVAEARRGAAVVVAVADAEVGAAAADGLKLDGRRRFGDVLPSGLTALTRSATPSTAR